LPRVEGESPRLKKDQPATAPGRATPLLVGLVALLVSLPTARNESVHYDDQLYLSAGQASRGLTPEGIQFAFTTVDTLYWHPLAWLSHEIDISLFGADASGHHFVSILFHAMTAALLCLVLQRFGCGAAIAAAGSLLWALHPLRVESFAWIAERKDVLCAFFVIATVAAYLRYAGRRSWPRYAAWLALACLALMSEPTRPGRHRWCIAWTLAPSFPHKHLHTLRRDAETLPVPKSPEFPEDHRSSRARSVYSRRALVTWTACCRAARASSRRP